MRILMTGVTSFVGNALAKELILRGHEVYGVMRPDSPNRSLAENIPGLRIVEADMKDFGTLSRRRLPGMDVCIHLAWAGPGRISRQDPVIQAANEEAALSMCGAAAALGCRRFLFSGSQAEYGVTAERVAAGIYDGGPVSEETVCRPLSEYGKAKLRMLTSCGKRARELGMQYIHLRIFSVYGEGDHPSTLVNLCCKAFSAGENLKLSACAQNWNMLYIEDCARAIADLAELDAGTRGCDLKAAADSTDGLKNTDASCMTGSGAGNFPHRNCESADTACIVNIGSEDTRKLKEFVEEIHRVCGKGSYELEGVIPSPEGTPWVSPDITRLRQLTGFRSHVSFREGVERIVSSLKN